MSEEQHPAPQIEGYEYLRPIGHGGFSDVYLYEQVMPRRQVAIKVLRTDALNDATRRQFTAEANLMARLSNHTNIASIYAADVDDDGQPYLVMEYCSGGSLGDHYRHYPLAVADVLRLGVRLCGALESAHRAGIVHRDIKPANILLTEYGVPVLSDFGISTIDEDFPEATLARAQVYASPAPGGDDSDSIGLSLPWAAPETLADPPSSDTRSDRYSLAATLYSLLEGRSPHEVPGGPNGSSHLAGRIQSGFVAQMKRSDVPESLRAVLRRGLSYDPANRFDSDVEMGRALQAVQRELGLEATPLEVPKGSAPAPLPPNPAVARSRPDAQDVIVRPPVPAGHVTLVPPEPGGSRSAPPPPTGAPVIPATAPTGASSHGGAPSGHSMPPGRTPVPRPMAPVSRQPPPQGFAPVQHQGPPAGHPFAPTRAPARSRRPVVIGVAAVVGVLAVVIGATWLISYLSTPRFTGPEVENVEVTLTNGGVYEITIPEGLDAPDDVQVRTLDTGEGEALAAGDRFDISTDYSGWYSGSGVTLNPTETLAFGGEVSLTTDELSAALQQEVAGLTRGTVLLVAAPEGYYLNRAPQLEISSSSASLLLVLIVDE